MFKNLKIFIKESAMEAVEMAEEAYNSGEGKLKKQAALEYVSSKIKLPEPFAFCKPLILEIFAKVIDEAIESAVELLKKRLDSSVVQ